MAIVKTTERAWFTNNNLEQKIKSIILSKNPNISEDELYNISRYFRYIVYTKCSIYEPGNIRRNGTKDNEDKFLVITICRNYKQFGELLIKNTYFEKDFGKKKISKTTAIKYVDILRKSELMNRFDIGINLCSLTTIKEIDNEKPIPSKYYNEKSSIYNTYNWNKENKTESKQITNNVIEQPKQQEQKYIHYWNKSIVNTNEEFDPIYEDNYIEDMKEQHEYDAISIINANRELEEQAQEQIRIEKEILQKELQKLRNNRNDLNSNYKPINW